MRQARQIYFDCVQILQYYKTRSKTSNCFQKLLKAEADRRVRMCNLQSAKDCASVKTSLATVHARAQEMGNSLRPSRPFYTLLLGARTTCGCTPTQIRHDPCFEGAGRRCWGDFMSGKILPLDSSVHGHFNEAFTTHMPKIHCVSYT